MRYRNPDRFNRERARARVPVPGFKVCSVIFVVVLKAGYGHAYGHVHDFVRYNVYLGVTDD
jgi:hypothetical protein